VGQEGRSFGVSSRPSLEKCGNVHPLTSFCSLQPKSRGGGKAWAGDRQGIVVSYLPQQGTGRGAARRGASKRERRRHRLEKDSSLAGIVQPQNEDSHFLAPEEALEHLAEQDAHAAPPEDCSPAIRSESLPPPRATQPESLRFVDRMAVVGRSDADASSPPSSKSAGEGREAGRDTFKETARRTKLLSQQFQ
jgi:hypothetical protein